MDPMQFEQMMTTLKEIQGLLEGLLKKKAEFKARRLLQTPKSWKDVAELVDRKYVLSKKSVTEGELQATIDKAKLWMFENPDRGADSKWTLTTSRVMTFLKDNPDRYDEAESRKKNREIQI